MTRLVPLMLCAVLAACGQQGPQNTGVYMLLDTSGTYREELDKAEQIIRYTLSRLGETDTFAVARIDTGSFSEKDIVAKASFDDRPSAVNRQKRAFAQQVADFVEGANSSPYTDISGGILQAVEYLKEDLEAGYVREFELELDGFRVIALNVTKLRSDNIDPREYLGRLESWQGKVEKAGGEWSVINDLDGLDGLL